MIVVSLNSGNNKSYHTIYTTCRNIHTYRWTVSRTTDWNCFAFQTKHYNYCTASTMGHQEECSGLQISSGILDLGQFIYLIILMFYHICLLQHIILHVYKIISRKKLLTTCIYSYITLINMVASIYHLRCNENVMVYTHNYQHNRSLSPRIILWYISIDRNSLWLWFHSYINHQTHCK